MGNHKKPNRKKGIPSSDISWAEDFFLQILSKFLIEFQEFGICFRIYITLEDKDNISS